MNKLFYFLGLLLIPVNVIGIAYIIKYFFAVQGYDLFFATGAVCFCQAIVAAAYVGRPKD